MKIDLYNDRLPPEDGFDRIVISLAMLTYATCTDEWGNSEEGKEHLAGCILHVNGPRPDEIKLVSVKVKEGRKEFTLFVKRDPCPVLFFGGPLCPLCGEDHA